MAAAVLGVLLVIPIGGADMPVHAGGPVEPGPEVVIVQIDNPSVAALGQWPPAEGQLAALVASVEDWLWIEGNHDPAPPPQFGGEVTGLVSLGPLTLRHDPRPGPQPGEVAGHLHPCAKVTGRGRSVRARCFLTDGSRLILPAFGAYTGGLNCTDPAFAPLFDTPPQAHVIGRTKVYAIARSRCRPDQAR